MAKKNFSQYMKSSFSDLENLKDEHEIQFETKEAIKKASEHTNKENLEKAITAINTDSKLPSQKKKEFLNSLEEKYLDFFSFENCPDDYENLKLESKFLAKMTHHSFLFMAQRLKKIRDGKLFEEDGYESFKDFIESEMIISRRTAYDYIDIISFFGVQALAQVNELQPSKLLPVIPLLRAEDKNIPKENLKQEFLDYALNQNVSWREVEKKAKEIKMQYGYSSPKPRLSSLQKLQKSILKLSAGDFLELKKFINSIPADQ